jgi:oxygen-independent coproporphyrinogen-3 oxidase
VTGRAVTSPFAGPVRHVYVHVPFCRERCDYCDFASTAVGSDPGRREKGRGEDRGQGPGLDGTRLLDRYVAAVAAQWQRESAAHDVRRLETLSFGGGTPSLLGPERLERLLEPFRTFLTPAAEVTVETNPEDVDERYARWAAGRGVRVSLGVQSFDPRLRAAVGRRAGADPAAAARRLRAAGVANLSVDLIHGIPGQTAATLEEDVAAVLALRPEHVSWYELDVVEGTILAERLHHRVSSPDDDDRAAGYRRIVRALGAAGYRWYEVSNFALPGRRARHNVAYWRARPYLGLGAGAVSTVGSRRWTTARDVSAYIDAVAANGPVPGTTETLTALDTARERLMLASRCGLRVPLAEVETALAPEALRPLADAGMISLHSGTISVTRKGRYVANEVCVRLFRV